ncbi:hypothetical protein [Streptomyces sp. NPDC002767]
MSLAPPAKGTATPASKLPLRALLALSTAAFTAVVTELLPAGLLPRMARDLGVQDSRVGFLVTGHALGCGRGHPALDLAPADRGRARGRGGGTPTVVPAAPRRHRALSRPVGPAPAVTRVRAW